MVGRGRWMAAAVLLGAGLVAGEPGTGSAQGINQVIEGYFPAQLVAGQTTVINVAMNGGIANRVTSNPCQRPIVDAAATAARTATIAGCCASIWSFAAMTPVSARSEEHTSELQSH